MTNGSPLLKAPAFKWDWPALALVFMEEPQERFGSARSDSDRSAAMPAIVNVEARHAVGNFCVVSTLSTRPAGVAVKLLTTPVNFGARRGVGVIRVDLNTTAGRVDVRDHLNVLVSHFPSGAGRCTRPADRRGGAIVRRYS